MIKAEIAESIQALRLPAYDEIPTVGLFLDQTAKYISEYLMPLQDQALTGSMISNYVKKKMISNPVKKQYSRDQICYLLFISVAKNVLSLEEIQWFIDLQKKTYSIPVAYNYFCDELKNVIFWVFELSDHMDKVGTDKTDEKAILRNIIMAVAYKVYLNKCVSVLAKHQRVNEEQAELH